MSYNIGQLKGAWGAGFAAAEKKMQRNDTLVGCYCHSVKDGYIERQGKIIAKSDSEMYRVQLFSWIDGIPTSIVTVSITDMNDWLFYMEHSDWVAAGNSLFVWRPT